MLNEPALLFTYISGSILWIALQPCNERTYQHTTWGRPNGKVVLQNINSADLFEILPPWLVWHLRMASATLLLGYGKHHNGYNVDMAHFRIVMLVDILQSHPGFTVNMTAKFLNLSLINFTPYTWTRSGLSGTYGLDLWDFPSSIPSGGAYDAQIIVDMNPGSTPSQATGSWAFTWTDTTHPAANLKLKVSNNNADKIVIDAELGGIRTINNQKGSTIEIELKNDQWSPFILVGDEDHLAGNNVSAAWMAVNLPYIGCLNLQQLTIPGSHDAGMSEINYPAGGNSENAQTQSLNIYNQLVAGVRYFDIRHTISHKDYYTGHYSKVAGKNFGANGQSIADIISDINRYLSYNQNELIILELTHSSFTDDDYQPFNDAQWHNLLFKFYQDLHHLYTGYGDKVLTTIPLSEFIKDGPAVVIINNERDVDWLRDRKFLNHGFYSSKRNSNQFPSYNSYTGTNALNRMRQDQYDKLVKQNANPSIKNQVNLLSWTLTQDVAADILGGGASIRNLADVANGHLAQVGNNIPYTGPISWATKTKPPNIILIDNVPKDRFLVSLALGLTRFYNKPCS